MSPESYETPEKMLDLALELRKDLLDATLERGKASDLMMESQISTIAREYGIDDSLENHQNELIDNRVQDETPVISPEYLTRLLPATERGVQTTASAIDEARKIINGKSSRLIFNVGPCSIHDIAGALEYAETVANWRKDYGKHLEVVMRFHTEKPRTALGWKGLTYDPMLTEFIDPENPKPDINLGVILARMLEVRITDMGVPLSTERLNTSTPRYSDGLIAVSGSGARRAHDQTARELFSGLTGIGFLKNAPDGSVGPAIDGMISARKPHSFLGINRRGNASQIDTTGNPDIIPVLRGGASNANYLASDVNNALAEIQRRAEAESIRLPAALGVDCSHMNSGGDHIESIKVSSSVAEQIRSGQRGIVMLMIESYLHSGTQKNTKFTSREEVAYNQSITDACIGLNQTREVLSKIATSVAMREQQVS